jgi:hypothetical protein
MKTSPAARRVLTFSALGLGASVVLGLGAMWMLSPQAAADARADATADAAEPQSVTNATAPRPRVTTPQERRIRSVQSVPVNENVIAEFDLASVDFGNVYDMGTSTMPLTITNRGSDDLIIARVRTSCGCTATNAGELEGQPIPPGDSRVLDVSFTPRGDGPSKKTMTLMTNAATATSASGELTSVDGRINIPVIADVKLAARLAPAVAQFGVVEAGDDAQARIRVHSRDAEFKVLGVDFQGEPMEWTFERNEEAQPGEFPGTGVLTLNMPKKMKIGRINEVATVRVKAEIPGADKSEHAYDLRIVARVEGKIFANPVFVRFPVVSTGEDLNAFTTIRHREEQPFKITKLEIVDAPFEALSVESTPVEGSNGAEHRLEVTGSAPDAGQSFVGTVFVHTDIENHGPLAVRFSGVIRAPRPTR